MASVSTPLARLTPKQKEDRLKLLESGAIADVTLRIPGKGDILAHRAILAPESDVMRKLFAHQLSYDEHVVVSLTFDTSLKALEALVRFCYCGDYPAIVTPLDIRVTIEDVTELHFQVHALAKTYNMIPLCRYATDQIAHNSRMYYCGDIETMLDCATYLLEHNEADIRKIGIDIWDDYLKQEIPEYPSSDAFVKEVMGNRELNERLLAALYAKAQADGVQV